LSNSLLVSEIRKYRK